MLRGSAELTRCQRDASAVVGYVGAKRHYTLSVPEDGSTVAITNPLVVYSITPPYYPLQCATNCTFIGSEGVISYYDGSTIDVDGPQRQLSVSCTTVSAAAALCITATSLDASQLSSCTAAESFVSRPTFTSVAIPSTTQGSSTAPPYPISAGSSALSATRSSTPFATAAPSASAAGLAPIATGAVVSSGTVVALTGDAGRVAKSVGGFLLALVGLFVAL